MPQAKPGDTVRIHYNGRLADGTVFDSSEGQAPLEFTLGENQVIPGFEEAVLGMVPGQRKTVTIPADRAYGARRPELVFEVPRDQFPDDIAPRVGLRLQMSDGNQAVDVTVSGVSQGSVTVDANHPLAGLDLTFDIAIVEIR